MGGEQVMNLNTVNLKGSKASGNNVLHLGAKRLVTLDLSTAVLKIHAISSFWQSSIKHYVLLALCDLSNAIVLLFVF